MEDSTGMTQRILNITLEIIYLLTGEDYLIVKRPGGRAPPPNRLQVVEGFCRKQDTAESPSSSPTPERNNEDKILQLTNKMIELLTGEVPIRCQDVAVYLTMEEREYLEGHKELYKAAMMEDLHLLPLTLSDSSGGDDMMEDEQTLAATDGPATGDNKYPMEEQQSLPAPGSSERRRGNPEEGHLPADTPKDGMNSDASRAPPPYSMCEEEMPASSVESLVIRIKEEPLSDEEDYLATQEMHYRPLHIKEELQPLEVTVPNHDSLVPQTFSCIKMETVSAEEDGHPSDNIYSPAVDRGKEEPLSCGTGSLAATTDFYRPTDPVPHPTPNVVTETLAYEIPVNNVPNQGPNNASVYSVRQRKDTMEILYHCPSCNKGFSSNLALARHQVIHTVDKLFICSLCGKSFTELSFLVKHQVIHTDLKRCVCQVCGGCFYSETSLAKHQKTHSLPAFCSICGKCFFDKSELAIHERKHTGERPFGCQICGKHFIAKGVLNKHMLTHTHIGSSK